MQYCKRCVYPANARPTIIFDEQGVCSGCRMHESRPQINWEEREKLLKELLEQYRARARENNNPYDCIIPVSGGKDSHFQAYLIKECYGLNPLLVTYNHLFNTKRGIRNLTNLIKRFKCDLIRFTSNVESVRKISLYMLHKVGDITWHYHAGIMTFPIQMAVMKKIPLMVWGEHGFAEQTGMFNLDDMVEFSKKVRQEHLMRGFEPDDILEDPMAREYAITECDLAPFRYPSDEEIDEIGVRGIYLSNFIKWDVTSQVRLMIEKYGFETAVKRERTFNIYAKLDDIHADGAHDYLKYLKFGYGRATDDAAIEIREGRMTREEGIEMVKKYDHVRPSDLDLYLKFAGLTEQQFENIIEHLRDPRIWEKGMDGRWRVKDSVGNHKDDPGVDEVRVPLDKTYVPITPSKQPSYSRDDHIPEDTEYIYL